MIVAGTSRIALWSAAALPVICGCALLLALDAPLRMPVLNALAFGIGIAAALILWPLRNSWARIADSS